jgi:hypothetical protein
MTEMDAADATMRPCLLVNPYSFRANWWGLARRAVRLARVAGIRTYRVSRPATMHLLLERLRERRQQQIWILSGDGTIQLLAGYFAARPADDWRPALLLLAGGRANIVPRECGGYPALPALRRALAALAAGRPLTEERIHTLQVSQAGRPVRHGFLFAGAVLYEGVRLMAANHAAGRGWLQQSFFADPYVILKALLQTLMGRNPLPPFPQGVARLPGQGELAAPMRLLMACTLGMGRSLYNPFAARGTGPVRFTAIAATATHFWRHLPAIFKGRFGDDMDLAHGFLSGRGEQAEVRGIDGFALDGQVFAADPATPLVLSAGIALRVLRP